MSLKFLTRFCSMIPCKSYLTKHSEHIFMKALLAGVTQPRNYAQKGNDKESIPSPSKALDPVKMPGIVHLGSSNEEEFFERKMKQQLREMNKRKQASKQDLTNPEKRD